MSIAEFPGQSRSAQSLSDLPRGVYWIGSLFTSLMMWAGLAGLCMALAS